MRPQLKDRIGDLEEELRKLEQSGGRLFSDEPVSPVRVALLMSGGAVDGIKSSLAGEALREYEQIYVEQQPSRLKASFASLMTTRGGFGLAFCRTLPISPRVLFQSLNSRSLEVTLCLS
jgi:hypothetical protein